MTELISSIQHAKITLPVSELIFLIVSLSVCLANKWTRSGLIVSYLIAYKWGWMFFAKQSPTFFAAYLILGGLVLILSVYDMLSLRYRN